ncbi:MAG: hypothetical protein LBL57_04945 [Tannerella sp.]|jgi:predicted DNA-binding transcriptional regulator YafY|nr:hypothetical protein [Tannerella sp.]
MDVFTEIDMFNRMHRLISTNSTGAPDEFAHKLGISRWKLYDMIDNMKMIGAPIVYSRISKCFYYTKPFEFNISYSYK